MKRFLTYDKKDGKDYSRVYKILDELKAKQLTESTYAIDTSLSQEDFVKKIKWAFNQGDNVGYISSNTKDGTFFIKVKIDK